VVRAIKSPRNNWEVEPWGKLKLKLYYKYNPVFGFRVRQGIFCIGVSEQGKPILPVW